MDRFSPRISRGCGVTQNTILTKKIMLNVAGWAYCGKCCLHEDLCKPSKDRRYGYMVYTPKRERILVANTRKEIDDFCMNIYKEYYKNHPEDHDWLPNPYKRKKVVSKVITVECK